MRDRFSPPCNCPSCRELQKATRQELTLAVIVVLGCLVGALALLLAACGPTPAPKPPTVPRWTLTIQTEPGAAVRILDGPNALTRGQADASGRVVLVNLQQSGFTVCAAGADKRENCAGVTLTSSQTLTLPLAPARPPLPPAPAGDVLALRADFLTLRDPDNGELLYPGLFPGYDAAKRARVLAAHHARGYTDVWIDAVHAGELGVSYDYLDRPAEFRTFLIEIRQAGLRPLIAIGLEDNPKGQAKYKSNIVPTVRAFVAAVDDLASVYLLGVEVREYWSWGQVLDLVGAIGSASDRPIAIHQNSAKWGPDRGDPWHPGKGGEEMAWWREAKQRAPRSRLALAYQCRHQAASGGGFSTDISFCAQDIRGYLDRSRLGGIGVAVIAAEYAYKVPEAKARAIGTALVKAGALGATNGVE